MPSKTPVKDSAVCLIKTIGFLFNLVPMPQFIGAPKVSTLKFSFPFPRWMKKTKLILSFKLKIKNSDHLVQHPDDRQIGYDLSE